MTNSEVRDVVRAPAIDLEMSHPPEQPQRLLVEAPRPRRLAVYLSRRRALRRDRRRGAYLRGDHDQVMSDQVVRTMAFRSLK